MSETKKTSTETKRLGRGLSSLLGDVPISPQSSAPATARAAAAKTPDDMVAGVSDNGRIRHIPVEWINPGPWQPRRVFDAGQLKDLAQSIKQRGLIQPIIVRPNPKHPQRYELIAGERRWRAAQLAALHEIPALITDYTDLQSAELALIENIQRQDLSVIEEADGYQALIDSHGYTQEQLAEIIGKSRPHIANLLRLRQLPASVREKLANRTLTMGQVRPLIGHPDAERLAAKIMAENLSARQAEALVKAHKIDSSPTQKKQKSADIRALEEKARTQLGLSVSVDWDEAREKGRLSVSLSSLEQFDGLLKRLGLF